jgi:hypothetical protein
MMRRVLASLLALYVLNVTVVSTNKIDLVSLLVVRSRLTLALPYLALFILLHNNP